MRRVVPVLAAIACLLVPAAARAGVTEYALPAGAHPLGIAQAPDGALWALDDGGARIARIASDGTVATFPATGFTSLIDATFDTSGALWFTGGEADRLGRASAGATLGPISAWHFGPGCRPTGVAQAPDGAMWFSKIDCDVVGRIAPGAPANSIDRDLAVPTGTDPIRIAAGPDGAMWFTANGTGRLGRVGASGPITWPVDSGLDEPYDLVTGPDGNLWVTEAGGTGAILRVTPAGAVTRFTAGLPAGSRPEGIAVGTDGSLYATLPGAGALARIAMDGTITTIPLAAGSEPRGIAAAADGSIWFTAYARGTVGRWAADPVTPPAVAAPEPQPQLGRTVVAVTTTGTVRVTAPGARRSYVLRGKDDIPVGSTVDTRNGHVAITSALPGSETQTGRFWGGFFRVHQSRSLRAGGMTTLELRSNLTCATASAAATRKRRANTLWGSDRRGKFRTRGRNATATVRGTVWRVTDRCDGTLVTVSSGAVSVRDSVRRRTVAVRRGHSYLARNRR